MKIVDDIKMILDYTLFKLFQIKMLYQNNQKKEKNKIQKNQKLFNIKKTLKPSKNRSIWAKIIQKKNLKMKKYFKLFFIKLDQTKK